MQNDNSALTKGEKLELERIELLETLHKNIDSEVLERIQKFEEAVKFSTEESNHMVIVQEGTYASKK